MGNIDNSVMRLREKDAEAWCCMLKTAPLAARASSGCRQLGFQERISMPSSQGGWMVLGKESKGQHVHGKSN